MRYAVIILSLCLLLGFNMQTSAQQSKIVVKGTVTDRVAKTPIPGVVIMSGKPLVAVGQTDGNGKFSISLNAGAELTFRYIGYKSITRKLADNPVINVVLEEEVNSLKEQVIIGYGKKTKEVSTGSSVIITAKEIQDVPVANVMELLQGKVAGLNIQNNNGTPGMRGSMNIRGISNVNVQGSGGKAFLTPTSPLFVVDGVPVDDNADYSYGFESAGPGISPISLIPVEDIQQIEVLKDAQATSLYGARGAYGVILITTKRGNSKVPIISYTNSFSIATPPSLRQVIGGKGERQMRIDQILNYDTSFYGGLENINKSPFLADSLNAYYNNSTNWQKYYYRTTLNQTHNVNISGGDQTFNYKVNTGYYNEKGIVENTDFTRYNLGMNAQYMPNEKFKLIGSLSNALTNSSAGGGNSLSQKGLADGASSSSLLPSPSLYTASNGLLNSLNVRNDNKVINITANIDVEYELLAGLRASNTMSYNYMTQGTDKFTPGSLSDGFNEVYNYFDRKNTLYNRTRVSYVKVLAEKHNFSASVFTELNATNFRADAMRQNSTPNDHITGPLGNDWAKSLGGTLNNLTDLRSVSLATAFSYNYMQKYVLDLTYRWDGSSTNGPDAGYSKSPSVAVRWNFGKEDFLKSLSNWLDNGGIRLSYGKNIVPTGSVYDVYGKYVAGGNYNQLPTVGLDLGVVPNTGLTPTTTTQYNAAFEAGFLNRFNVTFETYYKQVDNMLREKNISNINAFGKVKTNEMSVVNYGYELNISARMLPPTSDGFSWTLGVNGALNKDVMAHLPDGVSQLMVVDANTGQNILYRLGKNSLTNVLLNTKGVYGTNSEIPVDPLTGLRYRAGSATSANGLSYFRAGDPRWTDVNGDYILDVNDYVAAGNSQPLITGGINSYMQYKGFSLNVVGSFTLIRDILNNSTSARFQNFSDPLDQAANNKGLQGLVPLEEFKYWQSLGDNAKYPNPYDYTRFSFTNPFRYDQTLFQEDGSYFKLQQATVSYNLNKEFIKRFGISSMRVYGTAYNIYTFSNYSGPNPESVTDLGRDDSGGYPSARRYILGLNVQF
ncbi:MAG TPA: SusC/RagA family TonB-linked outer membrane protein [Pedobacter sp.]|uniref:SusC/RagA family TonB-linked outer membrane protein n=1 Tax=Pedobacter sp. TaxID=1411316 RepID=UPI002BFEC5E0|nr:SusC/RagA family TonB-linked outer membrane protein [Pedobacter sp.]HMI04423.1 SusC/RagA family TonB-linked outer membrane protein [Pedobacter sp.]